MHIILVSDRLATAKSITLDWRHLASLTSVFILLVLLTSSLFSYVTVRHAVEWELPFVQEALGRQNAAALQHSNAFMRENLNTMAMRVGQLQAQLVRLDLLGERLAVLSGMKPQDAKGSDTLSAPDHDRRGGPLVQPTPLSGNELQQAIDDLTRQVDTRDDVLSLIESRLLDRRTRNAMLPTSLPVVAPWNSNFGWRIDPFTGDKAMHEGVDFTADTGTPVSAAAGGLVISAQRHAEYGNLVEIDHGNELTTRYAHLSKILVKPGALVRRGQPIGEVGSTGRSTGAHLHFEVRQRGAAQNPQRFLQAAAANPSPSPSLAQATPR
jgi:murein DD-endopeptidase MepM/ murein hydrolase activator NlpD